MTEHEQAESGRWLYYAEIAEWVADYDYPTMTGAQFRESIYLTAEMMRAYSDWKSVSERAVGVVQGDPPGSSR